MVTVLDASPRQLKQDRTAAEREGLSLETVEGDMADLSMFADATFDLIVHPCSNCFVPDVRPVWRECFVFCAQAASCWRVHQPHPLHF
jgi:ubiquinone/menaquinone biosynthesis C-methylase UbiE